ncbi:MAG: rhomboid family intramembrane serine protease [bacterium]|nr:rhomboid family intramembrane serine protease [bacterium]
MIPLKDSITSRRFPIVNYAMIGLCTLAFYMEFSAGAGLDELLHEHALIPARFVSLGERIGYWHFSVFAPFFSSMFLHAGFLHFAGNMLFLWIFGDNVEDHMGHLGYLAFYLLGGGFAGLAHVISSPASVVPTIGASGAIAAVMGAYVVLYPRARIVSLVIIFFYIRTISVPAVVYLGLWFLMQILKGSASSGAPDDGGVAWWAHTGGFAFGLILVSLLGVRGSAASGRPG